MPEHSDTNRCTESYKVCIARRAANNGWPGAILQSSVHWFEMRRAGGSKIISMAVRKGGKTFDSTGGDLPRGADIVPAQPPMPVTVRLFGQLEETDAWEPAVRRLYELLDALVAWRVSFANGTDGDKALSAIGRAKVLEIRTILDTTIYKIKSAIDDVEHQRSDK